MVRDPYRIFSKIREDIRSSRWKMANGKNLQSEICHRYQQHRWQIFFYMSTPLYISPRMFEKIRNDPKVIFRDLRTWKKKPKQKISWHFPFQGKKQSMLRFVRSPETILSPHGLKAIQLTCLQQNNSRYKKQVKNYKNLLYAHFISHRISKTLTVTGYLPASFTGFTKMRLDLPVNLKWVWTRGPLYLEWVGTYLQPEADWN